ncbi:MAG: hypothetical protein V1647_03840 [Pseudomonadota bacterium]
MKKWILISICCAFFLVTVSYLSCGGSSSSSFDLFTTAEQATPIVTPAASTSSVHANATWTTGHTLYEIFQLIREYNNDRDNGVIDGSNMHKALYEANTYVTSAISGCLVSANDGTVVADHSITEQSITPPFDFGTDLFTQTYNCAYTTTDTGNPVGGTATYIKSFAVKYSAGVYYMLMGWQCTQGTTVTPSVMQVEYNTTTNDIKLNNAYLVNYGDGSTYNVRIYVNGNTATHLFSLKLFKYSATGDNPSIAGYGYSQGAGNYYLFKVIEGSTTKYFCFPSNATETDLMAMDDAGEASVPANCVGMDTSLPTNYATDGSESPTSTSKFTGAGTSRIELTWTP